MTNGEWVRDMSNEDLAQWLDDLGVMMGDCAHECCKNASKIIKWLESPQEES